MEFDMTDEAIGSFYSVCDLFHLRLDQAQCLFVRGIQQLGDGANQCAVVMLYADSGFRFAAPGIPVSGYSVVFHNTTLPSCWMIPDQNKSLCCSRAHMG